MLDEHMTPKRFWADTISIACYISNRIFLCLILNLTLFEPRFERKLSISHLRHFGCKCFILKYGNLDKFEYSSSDGISLGYTPHDRSYRVFNLETNTVVESCDFTFDKTAPCYRDVFECASNKKIEEGIFEDEELQSFDRDEDKPLLLSISSPELVPATTLEVEAPQPTTSSTTVVESSRVKGEFISEHGAPFHI
jgi:hypothetical protein